MQEMRVKKRNGEFQEIAFDKILNRVKNLANEANITGMNFSALVMKVIDQLYNNIETTKIDELTAEQCASLVAKHPDFWNISWTSGYFQSSQKYQRFFL